MHVRFSNCIGLRVFDEEDGECIATISGIFIHPDTAAVEGFFVREQGFLHAREHFLPSMDIVHWGTRIRVRSGDVLTDITEMVRLRDVLEDGRYILNQNMITEAGQRIGICKDVQLDTKLFQLEWLFPKRFWRWKRAVPVSAIVEVRRDAVIIRDPLMGNAVKAAEPILQPLGTLAKPGMSEVI